MAIYYRKLADQILITGKTYPYRDMIRSFGGKFQTTEKTWLLPLDDTTLTEIAALCKRVGGGVLKETPVIADTAVKPVPLTKVAPQNVGMPTAATVKDGLTVSELMTQVQLAIHATFPKSVWIMGEIQNFALRKQACFFELADAKQGSAQTATVTVKATLWQNTWTMLKQKHGAPALEQMFQDGIKVRLLCQVSLYRDRGQISLQVMDADPDFTRGALALQREQLLRELRAKGLDVKNKQLPLTIFPLRVGLISAEGSRAKSDFLDQLFTYKFPGEVLFYPAQMQGENTLPETVAGIKALNAAGCDVIVITRGGGSAADLRWFDAKEVAYAIAESNVPIIAAIGHHDDTCVAEEIAFRREKTPTAAADFLLHCFNAIKERLDKRARQLSQLLDRTIEQQGRWQQQLRQRLHLACQNALQRETLRHTQYSAGLQQRFAAQLNGTDRILSQWTNRLQVQSERYLNRESERCARQQQMLFEKAQQGLGIQREQLARFENKLVAIDPTPWLAKGWTQLFTADGDHVKSGVNVQAGDSIHARLLDALLHLKVEKIDSLSRVDEKENR